MERRNYLRAELREDVQRWIDKYSYKPSSYVIMWLLARILKRRDK